jgi:hypothetical protein
VRFPGLLQIFRRTPAGPKTKVTASSAPKAEKAKSAPVDKKDSGAATTNALSQAEQDAALAETEVADISRKHLATLLALPPRARLTHLDDPELTPGDQNALKLSVRAALPTANKPLRFNLLPWFRKWPIGRRSFATIVLLAIVGWPMAQYRRSPSSIPRELDSRLAPSGRLHHARRVAGRISRRRDDPA